MELTLDSSSPSRYNLRTRRPPPPTNVNYNHIIVSPKKTREKKTYSIPPRSKPEPSGSKSNANVVKKESLAPHFEIPLYAVPRSYESFQNWSYKFIEHNTYEMVRELMSAQALTSESQAVIMHPNMMKEIMDEMRKMPNVENMNYRLIVRTGLRASSSYILDFLPKAFTLRVNGLAIQIKNIVRSTPYDLTVYLRSWFIDLGCRTKFSIQIQLPPDNPNIQSKEEYYYGIYLMRRICPEDQMKKLQSKQVSSVQWSQTLLNEILRTEEGVTCVDTSLPVSLLCPISHIRIKTPCRGLYCRHFQCFDGETFIQLNQTHQAKWKCPVCKNYLKLDDLTIDGLFKNILARISKDCTEVRVFPDATYRPISQDKKADFFKRQTTDRNGHSLPPAKKAKIECITLDSDSNSDTEDEEPIVARSMPSMVHQPCKSHQAIDIVDDSDSDLEIVFENLPSRFQRQ